MKLTFKKFVKKNISLILILSFLILGLIVGFMSPIFSNSIKDNLINKFFSPFQNIFIKIIGYIAGPLIFFSIVSSIFQMKDLKTLFGIGRKLILSFIGVMLIGGVIASIISLFFFKQNFIRSGFSFNQLLDILALFKNFVAPNIWDPFLKVNLLQIVFISLIFGFMLLVFGKEVRWFMNVINKINNFLMIIIKYFSKLIPIYIFVSICKMIWNNEFSKYYDLYLILAIYAIIMVVIIFILTIYTSINNKISPFKILKRAFSPFIIAFTTANSAIAIDKHFEVARKNGISKKDSKFGIPLAISTFKVASVCYLCVIGLYIAKSQGIAISMNWLIMLIILATCITISIPPVPGGGLNAYRMLMEQLSLSMSAMPICVALDPIMDFVITGLNALTQPIELINISKRNKSLNLNQLRENETILICGAMDVETELLMNSLSNKNEGLVDGYRFVKGTLNNKNIIILKTGIQSKNAKNSISAAIKEFHPTLVISIGTSGAHNLNVHKGDVIIGKAIVYLDDPNSTYLVPEFPFVKKFLQIEGSKLGIIVTSDTWHKKKEEINKIHNLTGSDCEEMESYIVCNEAEDANIDNVAIRIVSNNELLNETYDRNYGIILQNRLLEYLNKN